jgi:uncharacterized protein (TIGR02452 family)
MANRNERAAIAAETVQILSTGLYNSLWGKTVSVLPELNYSINETRLFAPGQLAKIAAAGPVAHAAPQIRITNSSTLPAARQLHAAHGAERICLLNLPPPATPAAASSQAARPRRRAWPGPPACTGPSAG